MATDIPSAPWERLPNEGTRAYEAFCAYRNLDASERSLRKVAAMLGKSETLIGRWSSTHGWVNRVAAWDVEQDRLWRIDLAARRRKIIDRQLRTAATATQKVAEGLLKLDGETLTPSELTRLFEVAARIEREALGQPVKHEISGPDGEPVAVAVGEFLQLPAERRREELARLAQAVLRRTEAATTDDD